MRRWHGINITTYNAGGQPGCAPGSKLSAYCGDKQIDSLAGEECDDGNLRSGDGCGADWKIERPR